MAAFGSYRPKTLKTVNIGQKWPNFEYLRFSSHAEYGFLKENHKNNFHTKN